MSNSTAIAIREDQTTFDDLQTRALAHIGVETANPADLAVFFHTCKRTGLDPFARQIYMIRRDGKQTMQTGIDGLRLVAQRTAERTRETFGYEDTLWCGEDGIWHDAWLSTGPPAAARATVVRNGQRFPAVALFREYVQRKRDGGITRMWEDKGALMLAKCAEAQALRKAFPQDLSGIYTPDELPERREAAPAPTFVPATPAPPTEAIEGEVVEETGEAITTRTRGKMFALLAEVGETDPDAQRAGMSRILGREVTSRGDLTEAEGQAVCDSLALFVAGQKADAAQAGA